MPCLTAKYQLEATNSTQAIRKRFNDKDKSAILSEYEKLWLNNAELPNDAQLWTAWYSQGGRTPEKKSIKKLKCSSSKMMPKDRNTR